MGGGRRDRDRAAGPRGFTVQLRGLPYRVTEREIADWVSEAADPVDVIIQMDRERPSGRAECVFSCDREARRVVQTMHRRDLGHRWGREWWGYIFNRILFCRYIECFYDE